MLFIPSSSLTLLVSLTNSHSLILSPPSLSWLLFFSGTYLDLIIRGWWEVWRVAMRRVTESRKKSGNCECKSPWHSLKQGRREGESERLRGAHNYSSVRCEDEEDLKFSYTYTHTPHGYQEFPLTGLCFIISYRALGKDTLLLSFHSPSFPADPYLVSILLFIPHCKVFFPRYSPLAAPFFLPFLVYLVS